ncbi:hypothetical protein [Micromonospora sp. NPDC023888]|uniref:hypothetical protein n=1 Tax=Micromonospora sp. NPDC023888 TaxID=3155607 RepID=UPI0033C4F956
MQLPCDGENSIIEAADEPDGWFCPLQGSPFGDPLIHHPCDSVSIPDLVHCGPLMTYTCPVSQPDLPTGGSGGTECVVAELQSAPDPVVRTKYGSATFMMNRGSTVLSVTEEYLPVLRAHLEARRLEIDVVAQAQRDAIDTHLAHIEVAERALRDRAARE